MTTIGTAVERASVESTRRRPSRNPSNRIAIDRRVFSSASPMTTKFGVSIRIHREAEAPGAGNTAEARSNTSDTTASDPRLRERVRRPTGRILSEPRQRGPVSVRPLGSSSPPIS